MRVFIVRRSWVIATLIAIVVTAVGLTLLPEVRATLAGAAGAIVIDPGHGGVDPGAYIAGKIKEKDVNLDVSLRLQSLLAADARPVRLTRTADVALSTRSRAGESRLRVDLNARLAIARQSGGGLMVSVHANFSRDSRPRGPIVFYKPGSAASLQLARCIHARLAPFGPQQPAPVAGDFYILRASSIPSVLVEVGFVSNAAERELLLTEGHRAALADAIAEGIRTYVTMVARGEGEATDAIAVEPATANGSVPVYFPMRSEFALAPAVGDDVTLPVTAPGAAGAAAGIELLARSVLARLRDGPPNQTTFGPALPAGTTVASVRYDRGTLTVDFSGDIAAIPGTLDEYLTVYAIVNSLCGIPQVERVQFLVDGQRVETLAGHVDTLAPLTPLWGLTSGK